MLWCMEPTKGTCKKMLILKNWRWILLTFFLLVFMFLLLRCAGLEYKLQEVENRHNDYINHANELLLQARAEEAEKNLQLEKKYSEQIKKISIDADRSSASVSRLSKQLTQANSRIKTARREAVEEYARVQNHVLTNCIAEYRNMAKIADEHRVDAERKPP